MIDAKGAAALESEIEQHRIRVLKNLSILDSEPFYDDMVRLAADLCDTPIAVISLVDEARQWFKAKIGIDTTEMPRDLNFFHYTIWQDAPLVVEDALLDDRFKKDPLVTGDPYIRFYAGAPLIVDNSRIGALCVIDRAPRVLSERQMGILTLLARQVTIKMEA